MLKRRSFPVWALFWRLFFRNSCSQHPVRKNGSCTQLECILRNWLGWPVFGRLLSVWFEIIYCLVKNQKNKKTLHKSKWQSLLIGSVRGCSAPAISWPDHGFPIYPQFMLSFFQSDISQMWSPPPGGLPWLLCLKALSPPQHFCHLRLPGVSLDCFHTSKLWALKGHGLCCLALSPTENNTWD